MKTKANWAPFKSQAELFRYADKHGLITNLDEAKAQKRRMEKKVNIGIPKRHD